MTALPPRDQLPPEISARPGTVDAYALCLDYERRACDELAKAESKQAKMNLVYSRIVGYLLLFIPTEAARNTTIKLINCAVSYEKHLEIGRLHYGHFVRAFKTSKRGTPTPEDFSPRSSFDTIAEMIDDILDPVSQNHQDSKSKALVRDNFRCALTHKIDAHCYINNAELRQEGRAADSGPQLTVAKSTHIIPVSANIGIAPGSDKSHSSAAAIRAIFESFGYPDALEDLNGDNIHRLENVITMDSSLHKLFDDLEIWLEPTQQPKEYTVHAVAEILFEGFGIPQRIVLTSTRPEVLPLPSPTYIAIRAACARIAHLSGAAEVIDEVLRDLELNNVLAEDGGSADLLEAALGFVAADGLDLLHCVEDEQLSNSTTDATYV